MTADQPELFSDPQDESMPELVPDDDHEQHEHAGDEEPPQDFEKLAPHPKSICQRCKCGIIDGSGRACPACIQDQNRKLLAYCRICHWPIPVGAGILLL